MTRPGHRGHGIAAALMRRARGPRPRPRPHPPGAGHRHPGRRLGTLRKARLQPGRRDPEFRLEAAWRADRNPDLLEMDRLRDTVRAFGPAASRQRSCPEATFGRCCRRVPALAWSMKHDDVHGVAQRSIERGRTASQQHHRLRPEGRGSLGRLHPGAAATSRSRSISPSRIHRSRSAGPRSRSTPRHRTGSRSTTRAPSRKSATASTPTEPIRI